MRNSVGQATVSTMLQKPGRIPKQNIQRDTFSFASKHKSLWALFRSVITIALNSLTKLIKNTLSRGLGYNYLIISEKTAAKDRISNYWEEDICESYRKLFKKEKHCHRDTTDHCRAEFKDMFSRSFAKQSC